MPISCNMQKFIQKNLWNIVIYSAVAIIAFVNLSGRVKAIETEYEKIVVRLDKIEDLTERLIVIEERTGNNREDILEIKSDIKDLKEHFNLQ